MRKLLHHFSHMYTVEEKTQATIEWLLFKTYGIAKVEKFKADFTGNMHCGISNETDQEDDDTDADELPQVPNIFQPKPQPGIMPPAHLCFAMYCERESLGLVNICLLLNQMIVLGASNAVTERQLKAMNNIKTINRSGLSQTKLNNQYKIAARSETGKKFDAQKFVDHYVRKSIAANESQQDLVLQCGTKVPNVFRLKKNYKSNRSFCTPITRHQSHVQHRLPPQSTELVEQKDSDTIDVSPEADGKENELDLTPVERAIIAEQLREDELAHP